MPDCHPLWTVSLTTCASTQSQHRAEAQGPQWPVCHCRKDSVSPRKLLLVPFPLLKEMEGAAGYIGANTVKQENTH